MVPLSLEDTRRLAASLRQEIGRVIVGQDAVVTDVLTTVLAGGHCLLRGVPGLAKTLLVRTLAGAVDLQFSRIQFTPDLMPSDIIGAEVLDEDRATGQRHVRFLPGPVFANILLADEINRTPPRTQAALLEAMQEWQVTVGGHRHALPTPLFVLATQNPIEQEGTYPLPEAQLDRFMTNVVMTYPTADEEQRMLLQTTGGAGEAVRPVADGEALLRAQALVRDIVAATNIAEGVTRALGRIGSFEPLPLPEPSAGVPRSERHGRLARPLAGSSEAMAVSFSASLPPLSSSPSSSEPAAGPDAKHAGRNAARQTGGRALQLIVRYQF